MHAPTSTLHSDYRLVALQGASDKDAGGPELNVEMLQDLPIPQDVSQLSIICSISVEALLPNGSLQLLLELPSADGTTATPTDVGASVCPLPLMPPSIPKQVISTM